MSNLQERDVSHEVSLTGWSGHGLAKVLVAALGLVILAYVARLGPAVQGAFALFVALEAGVLGLFSGFGAWLSRQVAPTAAGQHAVLAWPALLKVLQWAVSLGLLASLVLLGLSWWSSTTPFNLLWLLAIGTPFLLLVSAACGLWQGQGRMWPICVARVGAQACVLAGLAGVVWPTRDLLRDTPMVLLVLVAWVSGTSLVAVVTALYALHDAARQDQQGKRMAPAPVLQADKGPLRPDGRFLVAAGVTGLTFWLQGSVPLFLVAYFHGLSDVGMYAAAVAVAGLLWLLARPIPNVSCAHEMSTEKWPPQHLTLRGLGLRVLLTLFVSPWLLAVAWWAVPRAMGVEYEAALWPLAVLLPGVAASVAATGLNAFNTWQMDKPRATVMMTLLSVLGVVLLGGMLVPRWGTTGAAIASTAGHVLAALLAGRYFIQQTGMRWFDLLRSTRTGA